jgi:UDP-N-acetyl-2-amino-2-deoxyglucuronate dehydrogenase
VQRFGLIGAAGFVAPRHLQAIRETENELVAATDPHDSVGVLDRWFPQARFFPEIERFDRYLEKQRRNTENGRVTYVSICSPNYLHDAHVRLALRVRAHAICEKPLVISPWNLDALSELESESGCRVYTVLQLRVHPVLRSLKQRLEREAPRRRFEVVLSYVTPRGPWYDVSWKGSQQKSGGLAMNIGVHLFDLLLWLFGPLQASALHLAGERRMAGVLELAAARVRWFLSVDAGDLPQGGASGKAFRSLTLDGEPVDFSDVDGSLHTQVYEEILAGRGWRIEDARPSIALVHAIRTGSVVPCGRDGHPLLTR